MRRIGSSSVVALGAALAAAWLTWTPCAGAQDASVSAREAAKHFERGVALYSEADYRGALVEFKRAYALAPNATVLYDVGQSQYQLQDYAAALVSFTKFIADSAPNDPRRAEVEGTLDVLRGRVGHVTIVTTPAGADVSIDDVPVGKTPLEERLLVSVGQRKITATLPGRPPSSRVVDVAADDNVPVSIDLQTATVGGAESAERHLAVFPRSDAPAPPQSGATWRVVGWASTGALAAGALTSGAFALVESNRLKSARDTFPVSAAELSRDSSLTLTYSIVADALAVAALAVGGVTLVSTLSAKSGEAKRSASAASFDLGLGSAQFKLVF
jgi:hypothetical protein